MNEKFWGDITVFELWLFCTAFNCTVELNDGQLIGMTCHSRRIYNED